MYTGMIQHGDFTLVYRHLEIGNAVQYSVESSKYGESTTLTVDADTFMLALATWLIDDTCERLLLSPAQKSAIKAIQPDDRTLFWVPASIYS